MHTVNKFATPFMRVVVKYGGNAMNEGADDALIDEISGLRSAGHAVVLVHGAGPEIDDALAHRGVTTRRIDGLRVTDADTLQIAESVLCATANKRLVRAFLQRGLCAVGISGQDGGLVRARRALSPSGFDLGFVGEIVSVDPTPLQILLAAGYVPVVSPIAVDENGRHAFNINADTVAGAIAAALKADAYIALTNVDRVLRNPSDPSSAIDALTVSDALCFAASDACESGMKPKMLAAIDAVAGGAAKAYICRARAGALSAALDGNATVIT
jgi:acetylglutamate kinase